MSISNFSFPTLPIRRFSNIRHEFFTEFKMRLPCGWSQIFATQLHSKPWFIYLFITDTNCMPFSFDWQDVFFYIQSKKQFIPDNS